MLFADLGLHPSLLRALERLSHTAPTAVQSRTIPSALAGHDLIVSAHTGSGKTGAFLLPALQRMLEKEGAPRAIRTLVLAPTRELAQQIERAARDYGSGARQIRTVSVIGGEPFRPQQRALQGGVDLVIATPGRLLDHCLNGHLSLESVETLVLDEADRMLDMGFADDIRALVERLPQDRQTLLFSATIDARMEAMVQKITRNPERISVSTEVDAALLTQVVHMADDWSHKLQLLTATLGKEERQQAIVFAATQLSTEELARFLQDQGISAESLHGGMRQSARQKVIRKMHRGHVDVLVATDVAARGVDVATISHVINFDVPMEPENYIHRIGRTARAGRSGHSVTLVSRQDRGRLQAVERLLGNPIAVEHILGLEPKRNHAGPNPRTQRRSVPDQRMRRGPRFPARSWSR